MKIYKISQSSLVEIPEPEYISEKYLYHATYLLHLESIMTNGLKGTKTKNWDMSQEIVYLAFDPWVAESYAESSDVVEEKWLDEIVILQIDTEGIDPELLKQDLNNSNGKTLEYHGVISPQYISEFHRSKKWEPPA